MKRKSLVQLMRENKAARCGKPAVSPWPADEQGDASEDAPQEPPTDEAPGQQIVTVPTWPVPLAEDAYHGVAGEIVRAIAPQSEADPVALLMQTLAAFGNVIGRVAPFHVEATSHYLNLFAVLVGPTAKARKGTSWDRVRSIFALVDPDWDARRVMTGLSSGEGLIWQVRDPIVKREPVKEHGRVVAYQDVEVDLRAMTKNSPAKATGAHVSLIGHITQEELTRYLASTEAANGFGNRFLWLCARRSQLLPDGGGRVDLTGFVDSIRAAVNFAREVAELRRDDAARQLWHGIYPALSADRPGLAGALTARAEAQTMRLACTYALLDRSPLIRPEHLRAALAVSEYCQRSVSYIFGESTGNPIADEILALLRQAPEGVTRTQIRDYLGRHHSSDRIGRAWACCWPAVWPIRTR